MRSKVSINLLIAALGLAPVAVWAGQPATRPTVDAAADSGPGAPTSVGPASGGPASGGPASGAGPHGRPDIRGGGERVGGAGPRQALADLPNADIEEAMTFLEKHSQLRYKALEAMSDSDPRKNRFKNLAAHHYIQTIRQSKSDPQLYDIAVRKMEAEDAVFGITTELHKPGADKETLKTKLRAKVTELVKIGLEERSCRLKELEKTVADEQQKLALDTADPSQLIEERMNSVLEPGNRGIFSGNPGSGGGGGRGRAGQRQPNDAPPADK
jgi:hypothetical protein